VATLDASDIAEGDDRPGSLAEIAAHAVALQRDAESVLAAALARGEKGQGLARRGRAVVHGYYSLREALRALPDSPDKELLDQLLNYHQQVVQQTLIFAYRLSEERRESGRSWFRPDLGPPGERLRALAERLA